MAAILALILLAGSWAVWQEAFLEQHQLGYLAFVGNVGLAISAVLLGVVIAPIPAPPDYSDQAMLAVEDLAELIRSTNSLIEDLADLALSEDMQDIAKMRLVLLQGELQRQANYHRREIARWDRIAPGTAEAIAEQRASAESILRRLDEGYDK